MDTLKIQNDFESLLNEQLAANYLGFTARTLQTWRVRGVGPAFVKISKRAVRYRKCDLNSWVSDRIKTSTSEHCFEQNKSSTRNTSG
jgi:hypothetical protein